MTALKDLLDKQAALNHQITALRVAQRNQAIAEVRALLGQHGLTLADISASGARTQASSKKATGKKVAPKYLNPHTGATWTGRGLKPKWLAQALTEGKALADFAI